MNKFFNFLSRNNEKIDAFQYFFISLSFILTIYSNYVNFFFSYMIGATIFILTIFTIVGNTNLNAFHDEVGRIRKLEKHNKKGQKEKYRINKLKKEINSVLLNMLISIYSIALILQETLEMRFWLLTYWLLFFYSAIMLVSIFSKKKQFSESYIKLCLGLYVINAVLILANSAWTILETVIRLFLF